MEAAGFFETLVTKNGGSVSLCNLGTNQRDYTILLQRIHNLSSNINFFESQTDKVLKPFDTYERKRNKNV
jgi:hypothetical protein